MSSRDQILKAIRENKGEARPLSDIVLPVRDKQDLVAAYKTSLEKNGGKFFQVDVVSEVDAHIKELFPQAKNVCSLVAGVTGNFTAIAVTDPHELRDIDVAVVKVGLAVGENGANWLPEEALAHRALPFITQHLVFILDSKDIVSDMHEAYKKLTVGQIGYGVFIAGPSKTADIEQSLVIGAHGARSLSVFVVA